MTTEIVAILGVGATVISVGIALAALMLTSLHRLEARMNNRFAELEARTDNRFDISEARTAERFAELEARTNNRFDVNESRSGSEFSEIKDKLDAQATRMSGIEQRQARLEGLLDGLREALFQRVQQ